MISVSCDDVAFFIARFARGRGNLSFLEPGEIEDCEFLRSSKLRKEASPNPPLRECRH